MRGILGQAQLAITARLQLSGLLMSISLREQMACSFAASFTGVDILNAWVPAVQL